MTESQKEELESVSSHKLTGARDDLPCIAPATMLKLECSGATFLGDDSAYESEVYLPKEANVEALDEDTMKKLLSKFKRSVSIVNCCGSTVVPIIIICVMQSLATNIVL